MKKKILAVVSSLVLAFTTLVSCGGKGAGFIPAENPEDKDKVALYVQNYYGGYGVCATLWVEDPT